MYNSYIITLASDILLWRLRNASLDMLSCDAVKEQESTIQEHVDASIELARIFYERATTVLAPEEPVSLLED